MKISIVIPTLGRQLEFFQLLNSIQKLELDNNSVEIIVVDQNRKGFLQINQGKDWPSLDIMHCLVDFKGLSKARNFGIQKCTGEMVICCDDDAVVEKSLVRAIVDHITDDVDMLSFKILDTDSDRNCMINFPPAEQEINKNNFYKVTLESAQVWKTKAIKMLCGYDSRLGMGTYFSADEGLDLMVRAIEKKVNMRYFPIVGFRHPIKEDAPAKRYYQFSRGTGFFFRKHNNKDYVLKFIFKFILKSVIGVVLFSIIKPKKSARYAARFLGFIVGYIKSKGGV